MIKINKILMVVMLCLPLYAAADVISKVMKISLSEVTFENNDGYQIPYILDGVYSGKPGCPSLPGIVNTFVLPPGAKFISKYSFNP